MNGTNLLSVENFLVSLKENGGFSITTKLFYLKQLNRNKNFSLKKSEI